MEQCPIKEMEIEFQCVVDTENSLFEPVPAKKIKPEWYKKLPALVKDELGQRLDTIKKCPAMHDWLTMGYLVRNRHTVLIFLGQNENNVPISVAYPLKDLNTDQLSILKNLLKENNGDKIFEYLLKNKLKMEELDGARYKHNIGGHPAKQVTGMSRDDKMQIKMDMDFLIKTPAGTSCYYLDPFLFDNPYMSTWQGIIDTDSFNQITTNNKLIFYPKVSTSFIIPKGTPLVQIVPFVRYPWKSKMTYLTKEEIDKRFEDEVEHGILKGMNERDIVKEVSEPFYAKNFKTRKEYS